MSPDPLATAQVNNADACAAAILPQTYAQARKSVHWPEIRVAMLAEIEKLERYKVWRIVKKTHKVCGFWIPGVYTQKPTGWQQLVGRQDGLQKGTGRWEELITKDRTPLLLTRTFVNHFDLHCGPLDPMAISKERSMSIHPNLAASQTVMFYCSTSCFMVPNKRLTVSTKSLMPGCANKDLNHPRQTPACIFDARGGILSSLRSMSMINSLRQIIAPP
jgi:hypothetical protein